MAADRTLFSARVRYWFEQTHGVRFYLGLLVVEVGLRPRRYRWRWGANRV